MLMHYAQDDSAETSNTFASIWFLTTMVENMLFYNWKQCRATTSKKARPALGPKNAPVSIRMLSYFNYAAIQKVQMYFTKTANHITYSCVSWWLDYRKLITYVYTGIEAS